jgi:hypothetical protein
MDARPLASSTSKLTERVEGKGPKTDATSVAAWHANSNLAAPTKPQKQPAILCRRRLAVGMTARSMKAKRDESEPDGISRGDHRFIWR